MKKKSFTELDIEWNAFRLTDSRIFNQLESVAREHTRLEKADEKLRQRAIRIVSKLTKNPKYQENLLKVKTEVEAKLGERRTE